MSNIFSKFKPLLACVAVGILTGLISKYNFQSTNAITIVSGLMAFCITTVVYIYFKQTFILNRLENLQHGIMSYEKQINKRILGLTNNIPTKNDFDHLEKDIQRIRVKSSTSKAAQSLTSSTPQGGDDIPSDDNKIVELHPKKNKEPIGHQLLPGLDLSDEAVMKNTLFDGIKIQLQPSISLDTKEIYSFKALPCFTNDQGELLNTTAIKAIFNDDSQQNIISQLTLDQTINLVRMLRRQKKSPRIFVELLACTLNNKTAFDAFTSALQAHQQVKKNLIIEIPQFDFMSLSKAGIAKLRLILNLGYSLALTNVSDIEAANLTLTKGLFDHIKLTIETVEELNASEKLTEELEIVSKCRKENVNIIVSGIEKEHQVIQLIDNHLEIAEGNFFSEPKFPSQDNSEKAVAGKK